MEKFLLCEEKCETGRLPELKEKMADEEFKYRLADFLRIFGDSTRIKILMALTQKELCVCDITELLNVSQSAVSHQLRILKSEKIVKYRKDGKNVYYSLDDQHIELLLSQGIEHIMHE